MNKNKKVDKEELMKKINKLKEKLRRQIKKRGINDKITKIYLEK